MENSLRVNNLLPNNPLVNDEIKMKITRFLKLNDKGDTSFQNLWDTAKAVPKGKFTALNAYIKKTERS